LTYLNKVEVETKALAIVETFTIEGVCELPPLPKEMLINGLFTLLSRIDTVLDKTLLQDPKACMAILMNRETIGTLCNSLDVAFGQWYLYPMISLHPPSVHN
jgi:hypothetical protein